MDAPQKSPEPTLPIENLLSPDVQQAIGFLFVVAGQAECVLGFHVLRLMAHPNKIAPQSVPIVSGMEVNVKLGILRTYAALHGHKAPMLEKIDAIRSAFARRNEFAHSVINPSEKPNSVSVQSLKFNSRGSLPNPQRHTVAQIRGYARAIHTSVRALDELLVQLGFPKLEVEI